MSITAKSGHRSEQLVYFAADIGELYLSKAALIDLQIISSDFPQSGSCPPSQVQNPSLPYSNHQEASIYKVQDGVTSELCRGQLLQLQHQSQQQQSTCSGTSSTANNSKSSQDKIKCVDLGPDWSVEFPYYAEQLAASTNPPPERGNLHKVQGEFSSGLHTQAPPTIAAHSTTHQQVHYDAHGRELAPCGCLKHTAPPLPPKHPPMPLTPENVPKIEKWIL